MKTNRAFDTEVGREFLRGPVALASWIHLMRNKPYFQKECLHMLTGRVEFKLCAHNYECKDCSFDQSLDEEDLAAQHSFIQVYNTERLH